MKTVVSSPIISFIIHFFKINGLSENSKINSPALTFSASWTFKLIIPNDFFKSKIIFLLLKVIFFYNKIENGVCWRGILLVDLSFLSWITSQKPLHVINKLLGLL